MTVEGLEDYSKDDLIEELINRGTFVGVVIFHRGQAIGDQLQAGQTVLTKSPPLTREGVEWLLRIGRSMVPSMYGESDSILPDEVPLRKEETGAMRVGNTRVLLELVIRAFQDGATPETIVQRYSTLNLADVYAVIAYYLKHREQIEEYLTIREQQANQIQKKIEAHQPDLSEIRERLLAQRRD
jgi:uncharacterized protein (DUF433 family)